MKLCCSLLAVLIFALFASTFRAAEEPATPAPGAGEHHKKATPTPKPGAPPHPGLFNRIFHTLHLSEDKEAEKKKAEEKPAATWSHLALLMTIEPQPLKLPETRQMKVTLKLENRSKKLVQLEFPTTQRIEVLVKNQEGKMVEHWSEDQAFSNDPGTVAINPGERVEYSASVATRDLSPGNTYTVEAFFPNYEALHAAKTIEPAK